MKFKAGEAMRVLIVGAGPTGLTAGVELARRGVHVEVIDQKQEPSKISRAVGILPSSLSVLTPSGVANNLLEEGIKIQEVRVFSGTRRALSLSLKGGHSDRDYVIALAQNRTEDILRNVLIRFGGSVTYGKKFTSLAQYEDRAVIGTNDGREYAYDMVIGADGIKSRTRECLGIEYQGFDLPETWSIADVDVYNWPNKGVFTIFLLNGGRVVVVVPLEPDRFRVISNTEDALATLPVPMNIISKHREGKFNISIRQASYYGMGRVFLAGDAAHCHSPVGGRGMNLGISDAAELASCITTNQLNRYSVSRHLVGANTIAASERARRLITSENFLTRRTIITACHSFNLFRFMQRSLARVILDG